jgi:hypothetical protein
VLPGGLPLAWLRLGLPPTIIAEGLLEKAPAIAAGYQTRAIVRTPCLPANKRLVKHHDIRAGLVRLGTVDDERRTEAHISSK